MLYVFNTFSVRIDQLSRDRLGLVSTRCQDIACNHEGSFPVQLQPGLAYFELMSVCELMSIMHTINLND